MIKKIAIYTLAAILGIAGAAFLWSAMTVVTVSDKGMDTVISPGAKVLVNKLAYLSDEVQVGDVVAFRNIVHGEDNEGSILVRRVAAKQGDTVEVRNHTLYINGEGYYEYMKEAVNMDDLAKVTLGRGQLFLMADNRRAAMDSRNEAIGVITVSDCIGKVCLID